MAKSVIPKVSQARESGDKRILVVDDDPALCSLLAAILRPLGYKVIYCTGPAEAARIWADGKARFDLLLADLIMPGQISGSELAVQLLREKPGLKVILTSGSCEKLPDPEPSPLLKDHVFLPKPFKPGELIRVVEQLLGQ
jgi:CheY-like chemotaxis protein